MTDPTSPPKPACAAFWYILTKPDPHEWEESGDYELGGNRTQVVCKKCGVPGERDDDTGEVYWPTT